MQTKKMVQLSLFTTIAMTIFIIESYLPPIVPIPGVKLGLANIVTLMVLLLWGWREGLTVLLLRVILGSIFAGQAISFLYSISGGLLCFATMCIGTRFLKKDLIWCISVIGGIFHNIGQIGIACFLMGTFSVLYYFPILLISGICTGIFTGVCTQSLLKRNPYIRKLFDDYNNTI